MRIAMILIAAAAVMQTPASQPVTPKAVAPMSELMVKVIFPFSDAIFYIDRDGPLNEGQWMALETKTLTLAEMANLMMSPGRAYNQDQWMKDAQLIVNVATSAYKFAKARDQKAIADLNAELYESCQSCHEHYRPGYRRRL